MRTLHWEHYPELIIFTVSHLILTTPQRGRHYYVPIYRWETWGSEGLGDFAKVKELLSGLPQLYQHQPRVSESRAPAPKCYIIMITSLCTHYVHTYTIIITSLPCPRLHLPWSKDCKCKCLQRPSNKYRFLKMVGIRNRAKLLAASLPRYSAFSNNVSLPSWNQQLHNQQGSLIEALIFIVRF